MKRRNGKKQTQLNHSLLDATSSDFQEDQFVFRFPKRSQVENTEDRTTKGKGRPKRSAKASTDAQKVVKEKQASQRSRFSQSNDVICKTKDTPEVLDNCSSFVYEHRHNSPTTTSSVSEKVEDTQCNDNGSKESSQEDMPGKVADKGMVDDLTELEKSVCSSSEKLCPSCKHIVCLAEYPDHFSKCLQKFSFSKNGRKVDNDPDGSSTLLPCPVCFKSLTSGMERRSHIKSCGSSHRLSAEQLILATRLQEKQLEERLALGLPSSPLLPNTSETKKRKGTSNRPKKASDPDMQLAFALSRSLAEEESERRAREEDRLVSLGLEHVLQEERRTLILPQQPPLTSHVGSRGTRGKKKAPLRTALTMRTKEERERIITEKVAALLVDEGIAGCLSLPEKTWFPRLPGPLDQYHDQRSSLWNFGGTGTELPIESHFVSDLAEFIKPQSLPVGELLRSFSQVPGRLNYTALAEDSAEEGNIEEEEEEEEEESTVEATIVDLYCTQLALAEMLGTQEMAEFSLDAEDDLHAEINNTEVCVQFKDDNGEQEEDRTETRDECGGIGGRGRVGSVKEKRTGSLNEKLKNKLVLDSEEVELPPIVGCEVSNMVESVTVIDSCPSMTRTSVPLTPKRCHTGTYSHTSFDTPMSKSVSGTVPSPRSPTSQPSNPLPANPSISDSSLHAKLIYDWSRLLASGDQSDLSIVTAEGEIPVHSLVLSVRCPDVLGETQLASHLSTGADDPLESNTYPESPSSCTRRQIDWSSVVYEAAYSFMVYLYSGVCTVTSKENDIWMGLFDLSIKYQCHELVTHLEDIYKTTSPEKNDCFQKTSNSHGNNHANMFKRVTVNSHSESGSSPHYILDELNGKDVFCDSTLRKGLDTTQIFSPEPENQFNSSPGVDTPIRGTIPPARFNSGNAPHTTQLESPDIFGEWTDKENSRTLMETPLGTPPGSFFARHISDVTSNFARDLNDVGKNVVSGDENDNADGGDNSIIMISEASTKEENLHIKELAPKNNLSTDFEELCSPLSHGKENSASPLLVEAHGDKGGSELPDLPKSPFSDLSYPSGNEVFDLTLTSDESVESHPRLNHAPPQETVYASPAKVARMGHTSPAKRQHTESGFLPDLSFLRKGDGLCPSNISSLIEKPIINPTKPSCKLKDSNLVLSLESIWRKDAATVSSSPVKEATSSSEKENRNWNYRSSALKFSRKKLPTDRNSKARSEMQSSSFHELSDESLLKAVCEAEKQQLHPRRQMNNVTKKRPKSKSVMDHPSSPKSFITPIKLGLINRQSPVNVSMKSFAITPLPDYQSMVSPQLQKELDKFGIRKLSRTKAIKLLLHIYEQMHPLISDSETETTLSNNPSQTEALKRNGRSKLGTREATDQGKSSQNSIDNEDPSDVLNSSQSTITSTDSNFDCLEETAFPDPQDDDITASQHTNLETRLRCFIKSDADLYRKVLLYEPIWANELQQNLKANGIKCTMGKLIQFLDEQCITFRLPTSERTRKRLRKNSSPNKTRKRRKNLQQKPTKQTVKS